MGKSRRNKGRAATPKSKKVETPVPDNEVLPATTKEVIVATIRQVMTETKCTSGTVAALEHLEEISPAYNDKKCLKLYHVIKEYEPSMASHSRRLVELVSRYIGKADSDERKVLADFHEFTNKMVDLSIPFKWYGVINIMYFTANYGAAAAKAGRFGLLDKIINWVLILFTKKETDSRIASDGGWENINLETTAQPTTPSEVPSPTTKEVIVASMRITLVQTTWTREMLEGMQSLEKISPGANDSKCLKTNQGMEDFERLLSDEERQRRTDVHIFFGLSQSDEKKILREFYKFTNDVLSPAILFSWRDVMNVIYCGTLYGAAAAVAGKFQILCSIIDWLLFFFKLNVDSRIASAGGWESFNLEATAEPPEQNVGKAGLKLTSVQDDVDAISNAASQLNINTPAGIQPPPYTKEIPSFSRTQRTYATITEDRGRDINTSSGPQSHSRSRSCPVPRLHGKSTRRHSIPAVVFSQQQDEYTKSHPSTSTMGAESSITETKPNGAGKTSSVTSTPTKSPQQNIPSDEKIVPFNLIDSVSVGAPGYSDKQSGHGSPHSQKMPHRTDFPVLISSDEEIEPLKLNDPDNVSTPGYSGKQSRHGSPRSPKSPHGAVAPAKETVPFDLNDPVNADVYGNSDVKSVHGPPHSLRSPQQTGLPLYTRTLANKEIAPLNINNPVNVDTSGHSGVRLVHDSPHSPKLVQKAVSPDHINSPQQIGGLVPYEFEGENSSIFDWDASRPPDERDEFADRGSAQPGQHSPNLANSPQRTDDDSVPCKLKDKQLDLNAPDKFSDDDHGDVQPDHHSQNHPDSTQHEGSSKHTPVKDSSMKFNLRDYVNAKEGHCIVRSVHPKSRRRTHSSVRYTSSEVERLPLDWGSHHDSHGTTSRSNEQAVPHLLNHPPSPQQARPGIYTLSEIERLSFDSSFHHDSHGATSHRIEQPVPHTSDHSSSPRQACPPVHMPSGQESFSPDSNRKSYTQRLDDNSGGATSSSQLREAVDSMYHTNFPQYPGIPVQRSPNLRSVTFSTRDSVNAGAAAHTDVQTGSHSQQQQQERDHQPRR